MDKFQAIDTFWNSFSWPAYDENTVPDDAETPRITYSVTADSLGLPVLISASLWDRSTSWESISNKAEEIGRYIDNAYPPAMKIDGGRMKVMREVPFIQRMSDPSDNMIRRIYLNVSAEFFTEH